MFKGRFPLGETTDFEDKSTIMRILLCNKFYYRRGGDCIYMLNLEEMLRRHGHQVAVFAMDYPENIATEWSEYFPSEMTNRMALTRPFGSREVREKFTRLLADFSPDVVHLNNIHTHLSPIVAEIAHARGVRVVWTLHDYKLLCPRYDCLRAGSEVCEACFAGKKASCISHRCMKGSLAQSVIGYLEATKWNRNRLCACTNAWICPSEFMSKKMAQGGFPSEKLSVLPNSIDVSRCRRQNYGKAEYYCYVGRLSHEKGVRALIKAANSLPYTLKVVGGGPMESELRALAGDNVEFVGVKQWDEVKLYVGQALFTVIPSEWYENCPLSVIEAQCLGTPVLGARIGGIPELIDKESTGMTFESGNETDLKEKIVAMMQRQWDYITIARQAMNRYDDERYYERIMAIYEAK